MTRFLVAALLVFVGGVAFYGLIGLKPVARFDLQVTGDIHRLAVNESLVSDGAAKLTNLGNPLTLTILVAVAAAILVKSGERYVAWWLIAVTAAAASVETALKFTIGRARPDLDTTFIVARGTSFPSGHAMNTTVVLGAIAIAITAIDTLPLKESVLLTGAATISLSVAATRVLLGVHYLTDVTAGCLLAVIWLATVHTTVPQRNRHSID